MRVPIVLPTRLDWLAMLLMIGVFGFIAQVPAHTHRRLSRMTANESLRVVPPHTWPAARNSWARDYGCIRAGALSSHATVACAGVPMMSPAETVARHTDHLRDDVRADILPYHTAPAVDHRHDYHHDLRGLRCCECSNTEDVDTRAEDYACRT